MDIIVVSHERSRSWRLRLDPRHPAGWMLLLLVAGALLAGSFGMGYWMRGGSTVLPPRLVAAWAEEVATQQEALAAARAEAEHNAAALARRIAEVQAHVLRLDAVGKRMTEMAGIEPGEFNFDAPPPIGGPEAASDGVTALDPVLDALARYERQLMDRERQFRVLEELLLASRMQREVRPSGWPIDSGWISSLFGTRTDPFNGRLVQHSGIDFAGRAGAEVRAVAAGIVSFAGTTDGYGNLVEINHGNGYVTRYGHSSAVLVRAGDAVARGQAVAKIGSTGRSTGPHVHFEVLYNGAAIDPQRFVQAGR